MIKFEYTEVMNFRGALRGMRNALNSWDKADSYFSEYQEPDGRWLRQVDKTNGVTADWFTLGPNDQDLCQRLEKSGSDHRKFLRQIIVSVDIIAPLYWWKEFDTYKVGTVSNSCSTMHTIHKKEFSLDDFSNEQLFDGINRVEGHDMEDYENPTTGLSYVIDILNYYRKLFIETKDKKYWWQMIQLLPSSYNQRRTITMNYETLRNIYKSRRNHKLDEWSIGFMEWIDSLPYVEALIKYENS